MEGSRVEKGVLVQRQGRGAPIRSEGGGQPGEIVTDPLTRSRVLVIRSAPTPVGGIKDRTELQVFSGVVFDRPWAIGMDVFIPERTVFTPNWHLMMQCHQFSSTAGLSPALSLNLTPPGHVVVVARSTEDKYEELVKAPMPVGRWVRIELEFTMGEKGRAEMWMDGRLVGVRTAILRFKEGDKPQCNLKVGTYRGRSDTPHEIRFDNVILGDSRAAVMLR
jgi:hypothetical protein